MFRLQADGRNRVYQVEIGAVLWKFPVALQYHKEDLEQGGCISCLGEHGPWIVERLIGMHEFPNEMDLDGKASMVEAAVRNMTVMPGGARRLAPAYFAENKELDERWSRPRRRSCIGWRA